LLGAAENTGNPLSSSFSEMGLPDSSILLRLGKQSAVAATSINFQLVDFHMLQTAIFPWQEISEYSFLTV
jgi:hypothetical protein